MSPASDSKSIAFSLLVLTGAGLAAMLLISGLDQITDPFVRNDDYPAYMLRADQYYEKTLQEGRWITYFWHLRPVFTPGWANYAVFLAGSSVFAAALALHALGPGRLWLAALTAVVVAVSPQTTLLAGWFNSLIPSIWITAVYAVVTLWLGQSASRLLLFVFIPLTLLSYSPYPLLLLLVCLVRRDNRHSVRDYMALMGSFVAAFALGMVLMYAINWAVHGVFGLSYSGWRQANVARDLAGVIANVPVLLDFYAWALSGLGFGNAWLGVLNVAAFFGALGVVFRQNRLEALYLLTGVVAGMGLLSLLALKDGVFIFFRSTQFTWAAHAVVLARACVILMERASPRAPVVVVGMVTLAAVSGMLASRTFATLGPFNQETRRIAAEIPGDVREVRIHGTYTTMAEAMTAGVQDESGLRLRLQILSGVPVVYCAKTPDLCGSSAPVPVRTDGGEVTVATRGGIAHVHLPVPSRELADLQ